MKNKDGGFILLSFKTDTNLQQPRMHGTIIHKTAREKLPCNTGSSTLCPVTTDRGGTRGQAGRGFKREGTYVYLWLIHTVVRQKPTQHWKAIILRLKISESGKLLYSTGRPARHSVTTRGGGGREAQEGGDIYVYTHDRFPLWHSRNQHIVTL